MTKSKFYLILIIAIALSLIIGFVANSFLQFFLIKSYLNDMPLSPGMLSKPKDITCNCLWLPGNGITSSIAGSVKCWDVATGDEIDILFCKHPRFFPFWF